VGGGAVTAEHVFTLPDLGEGLTEAEILRWLVAPGDRIEVDQPLVEVETAKAVVEVPSPFAGTVAALHVEQGRVVAVGTRLVSFSGALGAPTPTPAEPVAAEPVAAEPVGGSVFGPPRTAAGARPAAGPVAVISPVVRQFARRNGVDLGLLTGSGANGLILRADVTRAVERRAHPGQPGQPAQPGDGAARIPLTGARAAAARKYTAARREIPDATCWVETEAEGLFAARNSLSAGPSGQVGLLTLIARICVAGLAAFPDLNAAVDNERGEIVRHPRIDLGVATQSERGLLVPVVRNAGARGLRGLGAELTRLVEAARTGTLAPGEARGGTFTLNNYGVFGVDGASPILNHPEVAMLGVGRIAARPWAVGGAVVVRRTVQLSLTFDHRVCDGAYAAEYLRFVAERVENPMLLLADG
jgi:pyruvate dehydrogenase E2 component (dihydrolipoamide acetyltransferase)